MFLPPLHTNRRRDEYQRTANDVVLMIYRWIRGNGNESASLLWEVFLKHATRSKRRVADELKTRIGSFRVHRLWSMTFSSSWAMRYREKEGEGRNVAINILLCCIK